MPVAMDPETTRAWRGMLSAWDAWLLTGVLVVIVPALGYVRFRRLLARSAGDVSRRTKLRFYSTIVGGQWLLVTAMLLAITRHGLSLRDVGETLGNTRLTLAVTSGLLVILALVSAFVLRRVRRARAATLTAGLRPLRMFVPSFGVEMAVFVVVCLTAGLCEELLYRGWLVNLLRVATGSVWGAVVLGAAVFGVGHAYQGPKGIARATFVGLQLAILFVTMGSLIPGQVLHAGVDVLVGVAGAIAASRLALAAPASPRGETPL